MKRALRTSLLLATVILSTVLADSTLAQCSAGWLDNQGLQDLVARTLGGDVPTPQATLEEVTERVDDRRRPETPIVSQIAATTSGAPAPSPVGRPEIADLFAVALGQDAIGVTDGALTLNVNAFGVLALTRPEVLDSPTEYLEYGALRRFGAGLTLGGKGLAVDSDGDGEVEPAQEAEEATDIIGYEARWQVFGSRDPMDERNFERVRKSSQPLMNQVAAGYGGLLVLLGGPIGDGTIEVQRSEGVITCIKAEHVRRFLASPDSEPILSGLRKNVDALLTKIGESLKEIEHAPVWTLFAGGTERADGFGPDEERAGLRGAFGTTGHSWVLNLEWERLDGLAGAPDPTTWTLGGEWIRQWKRLFTPTKQHAQISASLSGERFEDVPDADYDEVVKVGVRLDYPIWENVVVPVSLTWANHASLIDEDDELVAHVGFSVDFKELLKGKKK